MYRRRYGRSSITGVVLAVSLLACQSGFAQGDCGEIEFSDEITDRFPNASRACLGVVERDGEQYAHFETRIVRVRGNEVTAEFRLPDGTYANPVSFSAPADARARIAGRSYRYSELARGQELDIYVPPNLWAVAVHEDPIEDFAEAEAISTVALSEPEPQVAAAQLPRTASLLPLIGLAGVLLTALGAAVACIRRISWRR